MSETEEAMRLMIMLGQLFVPGAQEIVKLFARGVGYTAKMGAKGAWFAADAGARKILNSLDGHGDYGWVKLNKVEGQSRQMIMVDALKREDLSELNQVCQKLGVQFGVMEKDGKSMLVFDAKNAEILKNCSDLLVKGYHIKPEEVQTPELDKIPDSPDGAAVTPQVPDTIEVNGFEFKKTAPGSYVATDNAGHTLNAAMDGTWSVRDEAGVVLLANGMPLEGKIQNLEGFISEEAAAKMQNYGPQLYAAVQISSTYTNSINNKKLLAMDAKAGYQTTERLNKAVTAEVVQTSVKSSAQRKALHKGQVHKHAAAHTRKRTL